MADLGQAGAPEAAHQPPGPGPGEVGAQILAAQARDPVRVAGAHHQRRGPEQDLAVDGPGQVAAQERQVGIRHRVDAGAHQLAPLRPQAQVAAAEGHDSRLLGGTRRDRQPVGPGAGAADRRSPPRSSPRSWRDGDALAVRGERMDSGSRADGCPGSLDVRCVGGRDLREVDDPGLGRVERRHAAGVRLDLGDLAAVNPAQARDLVLATPALQLVESRQLGLVRGDDQLAVAARLDPALVAVGVEQPRALDAEPRLERARGVVDAGVDHPARVRGLVGGESGPRAPARRVWNPGDGSAARGRPRARGCRRRSRRRRIWQVAQPWSARLSRH